MKKAERLNQELIYLADKTRFQLADIMQEFQISKRTALRDLEELGLMGLPNYSNVGRYGGYELLSQSLLPPVVFSTEEIQAIFFALDAQKSLTSTPFEKSYSRIREKLQANLPQSQQEMLKVMQAQVYFYGVAPVAAPAALSMLLSAILEEKIVALTDNQHEKSYEKLQIAELFYRNGIWFCSAVNLVDKRWLTLRCDFLADVTMQDERVPYDSKQLIDLQQDYEARHQGIDFRCQLTAVGREHFLRNHYPNMRLEENAEKCYIVGGYNADELGYMAHYLLGFGKEAEIQFPVGLKNAVLAEVDAVRAVYGL